MTPDDSFREMPLEVRVSGDAIAEIYGVRDFFGNYSTATRGSVPRDEEIWDEMAAGVIRERRSRVAAFLASWWRGAVLAAGAGVLVFILISWWAK
jgi:hypothetical protein